MTTLKELDTPSLILDEEKLDANIRRVQTHCKSLGVTWRPHVKTHKCIEIAKKQIASPSGPITVSTIKEAEFFAAAGITDIIYAVGIAPHKLDRILLINQQGAHVRIILDNVAAARAVSRFCKEKSATLDVLLEIDCDGHRSGIKENDPALFDILQNLTDGATFAGLITHAGDSYVESTPEGVLRCAQNEALTLTRIAQKLKGQGVTCTILSAGSTPTVTASQNAYDLTEYRSGVGTFFDLFMRGVGVCAVEDIALSVLVSVIGHQKEKGWVITDGGWLAMSRDRGTANQKIDCGYGLVCDEDGSLMPEYYVTSANQEHGIIARFDKGAINPADFPLDRKLRILPNHACPTAAAFDCYRVVRGKNTEVLATWKRINNW